MRSLYSLGIQLYFFIGVILSFNNEKARKWRHGHKNLRANQIPKTGSKKRIWFHISSLGEYEQAKPIIKSLTKNFEIIITFFSPSGFEHKSVREFTKHVYYIGKDTKGVALQNIANIQPDLFILVKYDFWLNHIIQIQKNNVPIVLISGFFRPYQIFFKWYGGLFKSTLAKIDHLFLQNEESAKLLKAAGIQQTTVNGDTRVDSVLQNIANAQNKVPQAIKDFVANHKCLVVGSSYKAEEEIILKNLDTCLKDWKVLVAPHNIDDKHLKELEINFKNKAVFLSKLDNTTTTECQVLIIDQIGLLKYLYVVAEIAFVGGGFGKTVHNTLEPSAFGIPLIFGPNYKKFTEAIELINHSAAFSILSSHDFENVFISLKSKDVYHKAVEGSKHFFKTNSGACASIEHYIESLFT